MGRPSRRDSPTSTFTPHERDGVQGVFFVLMTPVVPQHSMGAHEKNTCHQESVQEQNVRVFVSRAVGNVKRRDEKKYLYHNVCYGLP